MLISVIVGFSACSNAANEEEQTEAQPAPVQEKKATAAEKQALPPSKNEWHENEYFGLRFETPRPVKEEQVDLPDGMEFYALGVNAYTYSDREIAVNFTAIEMKSDQYDTKGGLNGAARNLVGHMEGTVKTLDFGRIPGDQDAHTCYGTFTFNDSPAELRGYATFDRETRTALVLIAAGPAHNEATSERINRIFRSIEKVPIAN